MCIATNNRVYYRKAVVRVVNVSKTKVSAVQFMSISSHFLLSSMHKK